VEFNNKPVKEKKPPREPRESKYEIAGWLMTIISAFLLLCAIIPMILGPISGAITGFLWGVFGFSIYPILLTVFIRGIFLIRGFKLAVPKLYAVCTIIASVFLIFTLHIATTFSFLDLPFNYYMSRVFLGPIEGGTVSAGGVIFGLFAFGFQAVLQPIFAMVVFSLVMLAMVFVMVNRRFAIVPPITKKGKQRKELERNYRDTKAFAKDYSYSKPSAKVVPLKKAGLFVENIVPVRDEIEMLEDTGEPYGYEEGQFSKMNETRPIGVEPFAQYSISTNTTTTTTDGESQELVTVPSVKEEKKSAYEILFGDRDKGIARAIENTVVQTPQTAHETLYSGPVHTYPSQIARPPKFVHTKTIQDYGFDEVPQIPSKDIEIPVSMGQIINGEEESRRIELESSPIAAPVCVRQVYSQTSDSPKTISPEPYKPISPISSYKAHGETPDPSRYSFQPLVPPVTKQAPIEVETVELFNEPIIDEPDIFGSRFSNSDLGKISIFDDKKHRVSEKFIIDDEPFPTKEFPITKDYQSDIISGDNYEDKSFTEYAVTDDSFSSIEVEHIVDPAMLDEVEDDEYNRFAKVYESVEQARPTAEPVMQAVSVGGDYGNTLDDVVDLTQVTINEGDDFSGYRESLEAEKPSRFTSLKSKKQRVPSNQVQIDSYMAETTPVVQAAAKSASRRRRHRYIAPPIELLALSNNALAEDAQRDALENKDRITQTLASFRINVGVDNITRGPTVTRYELKVEAGTPVQKIKSHSDDLEMELASGKIRIETPIPGKRAVGVEVPNNVKDIVALREIIESKEFKKHPSAIAFCLGKDITGTSQICELDKMPHLLIAGTTGSGKSVQLNSIILSIIYKSSPEDARIILVDPKQVEFTIYKGLPHLLTEDIICDYKQALNSFKWLRDEMDKRYMLMSKAVVRSIDEYNRLSAVTNGEVPKLPKIVLIVDELAELMNTPLRKELEENIMSIAQKARAAGIHLVLATQRPSVDVITGTIKANLSSRISFALKTARDSNIILDEMGAETLLGRGDMLYSPLGQDVPKRIQGAWVSIEEVAQVVNYVKDNNECDFSSEFTSAINYIEPTPSASGGGADDADDLGYDPQLPQVLKMIIEHKTVSTSFIQRKFSMGYARAARLVDFMEAQGYIGPIEGSKGRSVRITMAEYNELFADEENA